MSKVNKVAIRIKVPPEWRERLRAHSKASGESMAGLKNDNNFCRQKLLSWNRQE